MDFISVTDMNPRKYGSYLSNSTGQETSSTGKGGLHDSPTDHLFNATPFKNSASQVSGLVSVRRPRADTMPSRTTIFPDTASTTTDGSGSPSTTVVTPSDASLYLGSGSSTNFTMPSNDAGRRRSGSATLLSSSGTGTSRQNYGNTLFTSSFAPYHMMDENATDTVQSTLASLGLGDTLNSDDAGPYLSSTASTSPQTAILQRQQQQQQQQQLQRHRSYTVATRHPSTSDDRLDERLSMGFRPFSPQTRLSIMQRPRAVSVGVVDDPHFGDQVPSFLPFDMTSLQSTEQAAINPSVSHLEQYAHYQQQPQPQQQQLSPLGQQVPADTQQSLRVSRSSRNLTDLSGATQFDNTGTYDSGSAEALAHQDVTNVMPSVSSSTSALLDSPSSPPAHIPSRALWLGNINPSLSVNDLIQQFSLYGTVESARILSDKECAFVNFSNVESAVAAKNDLESRLGSNLGGSLVRVGFGKANVTLAMALTNEAGPNAQGPTRALWVAPVNMNTAILQAVFQAFGPIESIRILSHKNCGFVNFERQEDAVRARKNLQNKEILGPGSGAIRIGFAKTPSADDMNNADRNADRHSVTVSPHSQTIASTQYQMYQQQQHTLPQHQLNQNQNFTSQSQLVYQHHQQPQLYMPHAYSRAQPGMPFIPNAAPQHDIHSNNASAVLPPVSTFNKSIGNNNNGSHGNNNQGLSPDTYQATQWATAMMMTTMMMNASGKNPTTQPSLYTAIATERQFIMQQLCFSTDTAPMQHQAQRECPPISYYSMIPPVPELSSERTLDPLRLRDMRKRLESGQALQDVETIAQECMNEIVELCSDYIGNTIIQKLFEHCSESTKQSMLERIAPSLAAIGVHKNGTWAAQKIIDYANTPRQVELIRQHIAPYVPLLLLDQFGNYVVQCCLRMGVGHNQYIFDAIVDKCWEIGQGRFGARALRAILENSVVSKEQQIYCAAAIVQNAVLLTTNANGTLLLVWLLDTSELSGRYRVLYPRLLPYLSKLCTHKLGSVTVFKIIQQQQEPNVSRLLLNALTTDSHLLDTILHDQIHGVALVQKILALPHISSGKQQRVALVQLIRASLDRLNVHQMQGYRKLIDELDSLLAIDKDEASISSDGNIAKSQQGYNSTITTTTSSSSSSSSSTLPNHQQHDPLSSSNSADGETPLDILTWMKNPQTVALMANMYAAAMTSATTTQQQQQVAPSTKEHELPQFNHILKSLLSLMPSASSPSLATSDSSATMNKNVSDDPPPL